MHTTHGRVQLKDRGISSLWEKAITDGEVYHKEHDNTLLYVVACSGIHDDIRMPVGDETLVIIVDGLTKAIIPGLVHPSNPEIWFRVYINSFKKIS